MGPIQRSWHRTLPVQAWSFKGQVAVRDSPAGQRWRELARYLSRANVHAPEDVLGIAKCWCRPQHKGVSATVIQTRRSSPAVTRRIFWVGSLLLAGLAWIPTIQQSRGMWSIPGTMGMSLGAFLVFWTVMMVAMMGPSLAPTASLHLETARLRTHPPHLVAQAGAFVMGYFLVWTAFGLPIFGLAGLEGHFTTTAPPVASAAAAVVLVAAGFYQLTPLRARCLASCNQHLGAQAHIPLTRYPCRRSERGWRMAWIAWGHVADACWH